MYKFAVPRVADPLALNETVHVVPLVCVKPDWLKPVVSPASVWPVVLAFVPVIVSKTLESFWLIVEYERPEIVGASTVATAALAVE
jgi:hypothetical protein